MNAHCSRPTVLVVDDDEPLANALVRMLDCEGFDVAVAHEGQAALDHVTRHQPDLVVLDVMLPGVDGITICERLPAYSATTRVLMLTARDEIADRVRGLDAGADDYLVKPFAYDEFMARVRALLRRFGRSQPTPHRRVFADVVLDVDAREVRRGGRLIELSPLEFDLLAFFAAHPRQVLTRAQMLDGVWAGAMTHVTNVVDVYVGYLRAKLEANGESRLIHTVRGVGYVLRVR